jgi:predicted  nucleic acid-binding Zn ribbon protein
LKEIAGFSEKEINVFLLMHTKGRVTEKEIPKLFDIPTFYKLYKMGFIEKITEL